MKKNKRTTRPIEMYIGENSSSDNCGNWSTDYIDIPIDTPKDKIHEVAIKAMEKELEDEDNIAFIGVYAIPSLDELDDYELLLNQWKKS